MKWIEIAVDAGAEATEAISELLMGFGAGGVAVEDRRMYQVSGTKQFGEIAGVAPEDLPLEGVRVTAYFPNSDVERGGHGAEGTEEAPLFPVQMLREALDKLPSYGLDTGEYVIHSRVVDEDNWAHAWKTYFKPARVSKRLTVVPSWEPYSPQPGEITITLDPGMAFGTGTHPTTSMCMQLLDKHVSGGEIVYDVGTGTGILSIAAAKLGARKVVGFDLDPVAVSVAQGNVREARLGDIVDIRQNDLLVGIEGTPSIIVANILAEIIVLLIPDANRLLSSGGLLIVSGIINEKENVVCGKLQDFGFQIGERVVQGDWVAISAYRR